MIMTHDRTKMVIAQKNFLLLFSNNKFKQIQSNLNNNQNKIIFLTNSTIQ